MTGRTEPVPGPQRDRAALPGEPHEDAFGVLPKELGAPMALLEMRVAPLPAGIVAAAFLLGLGLGLGVGGG